MALLFGPIVFSAGLVACCITHFYTPYRRLDKLAHPA
ncbi:hypothetical protein, unlikely [Trypanosoma brucei brucei TREU927]|uniref:Uncharacterized protein n=1 Tax=Trypanosoma brucei brucei (strain 927/4 GUTat10.1) TaxID=185431 RepID=Q4GYP9_TRYB2|nr:hypothetical protein, unlikely [Trypanosoma brucei brucei TREU927]CAJ16535.1 hypothetical protein, unlikely [Trypanosoma brucei brucei TREU927]